MLEWNANHKNTCQIFNQMEQASMQAQGRNDVQAPMVVCNKLWLKHPNSTNFLADGASNRVSVSKVNLPLTKMGDFNNLQQQELQQYLLGNCYATWSLWRQSCAQLQQQRLAMACFFDPQTVSQNSNLCHWAVNVSCTKKKLQEMCSRAVIWEIFPTVNWCSCSALACDHDAYLQLCEVSGP